MQGDGSEHVQIVDEVAQMNLELILILAVIIVALSVWLSRSSTELKMSKRWKREDYLKHERADRAQWGCYFGD